MFLCIFNMVAISSFFHLCDRQAAAHVGRAECSLTYFICVTETSLASSLSAFGVLVLLLKSFETWVLFWV